MLATPEYFIRTALGGGKMEEPGDEYGKNIFLLTFSEYCTSKCKICNRACDETKTEMLSMEWIKKAFEETKDVDWNLILKGGESMLFPEYCKEIIDLWRTYDKPELPIRKNICLVTNGFWGADQKLIDFVTNKLKPSLIEISISEWHQEFTPISSVNNIIRAFENHSDIHIGFIQICSKNIPKYNFMEPFNREKIKEQFGLECNSKPFIFQKRVNIVGRALETNMTSEIDNSEKIFSHLKCESIGFNLFPEGDIVLNCPMERGCKLGNIKTDNLKEVYNKLISIPRFTMKSDKPCVRGLAHDICSAMEERPTERRFREWLK